MSDGGTCPCGSGWFVLGETKDGQRGQVSIEKDGRVTGLYGSLNCAVCGLQWMPPRDRLKVVPG